MSNPGNGDGSSGGGSRGDGPRGGPRGPGRGKGPGKNRMGGPGRSGGSGVGPRKPSQQRSGKPTGRPPARPDDQPWRKADSRFTTNVDTVEPIYLKTNMYFAQIAGGLEELGAKELVRLGATDINIINRGIDFKADRETLYRINYRARLITRVLAPMHKFRAENPDALYLETKRIDWTNIFRLDQTFAVFANLSNSNIDHSHYASLKVKDSVVDMFRKRFRQQRPNVDSDDPDLWICLHMYDNQATLSIDCSGGSLHKRGYRQQAVEAPIQETLAAAILDISGWDGKQKLYDPMCGSGTLLSEAWIKAGNIPAQTLRKKFGFMMLPNYDRRVWVKVKFEEENKIKMVRGGLIRGSDVNPKAVTMTRGNNARLPFGDELIVKTKDFRDLPVMENHMIVCNPPYGVRMMNDADMGAFYKEFGDFLKQKCKGGQAFVYFGDRELVGTLGLKASMKMPIRNGGLDGRLVWYELY